MIFTLGLEVDEYESTCGGNMSDEWGSQYKTQFSNAKAIQPDFEWDDIIQGKLLAAYGFGYILANLSGGTLCALCGGKKYMAVTMAIIGVMQLISPVAALHSHWLLWSTRFLFGACVSIVEL